MPGAIAGSFRRIAAAAYDGLLLGAVLMAVTALLMVATHGEAITRARVGAFEYLYCAVLLACIGGYFAIAWRRRGQTLGMKAWNIRLEAPDGARPGRRGIALRLAIAAPLYLLAIAGVALLIARRGGALAVLACAAPLLVSYAWQGLTGRGTLHDLASRTCVRHVPARA